MRRELSLVFLAISAMIVTAFVVPLGLSARATARDRALDVARAEAAELAPMLATGDPATVAAAVEAVNGLGRHQLTVVLVDGTELGVLVAERARLETALATATSLDGPAGGGHELVTAVALPAGPSAIRVFVPDAELRRGVVAAWATLGGLGVVLVLGAVAMADRIAQRLVRPAAGLAHAARALGDGDFAVRVDPSGPPELATTAEAFNSLVERVEKMVADEREMIAELTHRLRTPLTRLRVGLDQVPDQRVAAKLHGEVELLTAEVNDLIMRARQRVEPPGRVDLGQIVAERFAFWSALATDERRPGSLERNDTVHAAVERDELEAAIDVLIENVFAHTPSGQPFSVAVVARPDGGGSLVVEDGGSGFDPSLADLGESGSGSTGLGLAIVRRLLARCGGSMSIGGSRLGGARIQCDFPATRSDPQGLPAAWRDPSGDVADP